jgi:hypothetical protein
MPLLSCLVPSLLVACAGLDVVPVPTGGVPALGRDQGILVAHLDTRYPGIEIGVEGAWILEALPVGRHLRLLVVPAGDYRWSRLRWDRQYRSLPADGYWKFRVEPGRLSYPGQILVRGPVWDLREHLGIRARTAQAIAEIERLHPGVLDTYPLAYTGSDVDDFAERFEAARQRIRGGGKP